MQHCCGEVTAGVREGTTWKGSEKGKRWREGERGAFPCLSLVTLMYLTEWAAEKLEGSDTNVLIFVLKRVTVHCYL